MTENEIGAVIVDTAVEVHRRLGPGLLESVYEAVVAYELAAKSLAVQRQVPVRIEYKGLEFDEAFRADLVVESRVIVELKSVEVVSNAHRKQIQTYLRLTGMKLGYLLNFGAALMKDGIVRTVNGLGKRRGFSAPQRLCARGFEEDGERGFSRAETQRRGGDQDREIAGLGIESRELGGPCFGGAKPK